MDKPIGGFTLWFVSKFIWLPFVLVVGNLECFVISVESAVKLNIKLYVNCEKSLMETDYVQNGKRLWVTLLYNPIASLCTLLFEHMNISSRSGLHILMYNRKKNTFDIFFFSHYFHFILKSYRLKVWANLNINNEIYVYIVHLILKQTKNPYGTISLKLYLNLIQQWNHFNSNK